MYISRVRVSNVRGFSGPREVDLTLTRPDGSHAGWTVVAGRNGSGKTTLLRAMALVVHGPRVALRLDLDDTTWVTAGEQAGSSELSFSVDPKFDEPIPVRPGDVPVLRLNWSNPGLSSNVEFLSSRSPWLGETKGWLCAGYGPFRRLSGKSDRDHSRGAMQGIVTLFDEEASLAEGVAWLVRQQLRAYEEREGAQDMLDAVLGVLGDGLLPDGYEVRGVDSDGLWVSKGGRRLPLREMSDGYRTVTALVVDIINQIYDVYGELLHEGAVITAPGVVLIDEVDAHLHVSWQKRIGGWLTKHFPNIQFVVTTHSPYVCQAADPGGLIRLPGPDEDVAPHVVDDDLYSRIVYGSGDDAVLSELFGLETGYSDRARELRRELSLLEAQVVSGHADDEQIGRYRELSRTLTSSPSARADEVAARIEAARASEQ